MSKSDILLKLFTTACMTIAIFATLYTIWMVGPSLETRFWPVVSKLQVLSVEATPDGFTKVKAGFNKLRDCEYIRIAWYAGDRSRSFEQVPVTLQRAPGDNGSPNRPLGYQRAGPWIIGITPAELKQGSFAQLSHRCHPFWTTITEFYP